MGGFLRRFFAVGPNPGDPDERVIARLLASGADLSKPREIIHYLYFNTEASTLAAVQALDRDDRLVHAKIDPSTGKSRVRITLTAIVTPELVNALRDEFEGTARIYGGEYDGWEAAATP